jgi:hypothetical protein
MSDTFKNFFSEKIDDLKIRASELGIDVNNGIRKQELIKLIKENILQDKPGKIEYIYGPSVPKKYYKKIMNEDHKKGINCYNYQTKYETKHALGQGAYGATWKLCKNSDEKKNDCEYVLKKIELNRYPENINKWRNNYYVESFLTEVQALVELGKTGFVPKIYNAWICGDTGYYIMERLEKINFDKDFDFKQAKHMLEVFEKLGWVHADTHEGNLMKDKNGNLKWIDFGFAAKKNLSQNKNKNQMFNNHILNIIKRRGITTWNYLIHRQYNILYEHLEKYDRDLMTNNQITNKGRNFRMPKSKTDEKKREATERKKREAVERQKREAEERQKREEVERERLFYEMNQQDFLKSSPRQRQEYLSRIFGKLSSSRSSPRQRQEYLSRIFGKLSSSRSSPRQGSFKKQSSIRTIREGGSKKTSREFNWDFPQVDSDINIVL